MKTIMAVAALLLSPVVTKQGRRMPTSPPARPMPSRFAPPATPCCRTRNSRLCRKPRPSKSVANTPGMTELALTVWLQSSHPTMPNIVLKQDDLRNVVAYIRSLETD